MSDILEHSSVVISKNFSLSFGDFKILSFCYLPLVGSEALGLYDFFLSYGDGSSPFLFGKDCFIYTGLTIATLNQAKKKLEAVGLLETYHKGSDDEEDDSFLVQVLPPLSPKKFFDDKILSALLENKIGFKAFGNIQALFIRGEKIDSSFKKESAAIGAMFPINDLDLSTNNIEQVGLEDKNGKKTSSAFNEKEFKKELQGLEIPFRSIANDIEEIYSCSSFYNLTAKDAANMVQNSTNSNNIFYKDKFLTLCHDRCHFLYDAYDQDDEYTPLVGENFSTAKYKEQDETNPLEFLARKLHLKYVPDDTQDSLRKFRDEFNFPDGVVNNIIDYCIMKNEGSLPPLAYWEKVALTIVGKKPKNAYECSLYLESKQKEFKRKRDKKIARDTGIRKNLAGIKEEEQEKKIEVPKLKVEKNDDDDMEFTQDELDFMNELDKKMGK